jgi:hypothetical protein
MLRTHVPRVVPSLGIAIVLAAPLACSKSGEGEGEGKAQQTAPTAATAETPAKEGTVKPPIAKPAGDGITKVVADAAAAGEGRLDRGDALGHFVVPNPSGLLGEVRTQASPPTGAAVLNEASLRALAGLGLGSRAGVADHIALDQPMGCVLVDDAAIDAPVACALGYAGGSAAATTDLGAEGKQADAAGHVAHYVVEGQHLYLDDLGGHVVVTNHTAVFAKAKGYLESNVIGRAGTLTDDVEVVLYPKAAMGRYSKQIESFMSMMRGTPTVPADNPLAEAFAEYSRTSTERGFDYYRDVDQASFGLGLEPVGFVFRYAIWPTPGSSAQSDSQAVAAGPIDAALVQQLPAESWLVTASTIDWKAVWQLESAAPMREVMVDAYAKAVGRDPATVRTAIETFLEENSTLYARDFAFAIMHLPGTQGGLVVSRKLASPARASWKPWTDGFDPTSVLGPEGIKLVTWSFQADALEVDGLAVDRWTIEPGPDAKLEIAKKADPVIAEIERRFGGLRLEIDRVELPDRVLFVVAPGAQERYIRAAIAAAKGGASTSSDAGLRGLLARNPDTSAIMAVDVAGAVAWLGEVLPPEAAAKLGPVLGLGADLGDVYFSATYGASGRQYGEMVLSQGMIDGLRKLAG